jgi:serine/threonine protein kinase
MNDSDSDKTRVGLSPSFSEKNDRPITNTDDALIDSGLVSSDKTRVRTYGEDAHIADKTSIQTHSLRPGLDGTIAQESFDKTRSKQPEPVIAGSVGHSKKISSFDGLAENGTADSNMRSRDELTKYTPKKEVHQDKTRLRQSSPVVRDSVELESVSAAIDVTRHDILKGRFVLENVLGAGGMGVVYKAKDLLKVEAQDRDPYVAIKVLSEEFRSHPEAFISLQRESRKSQRIAHPNIVNVYDFDRDGDTVFMTMEYMDGTPLDKLIKQYKSTGLPTDDAWAIIDGISSALSHAHAENIIHSDFKPGNIFVTNKGVAKVFDFGISRAVAIAERTSDNQEDKTIFDAGTLGALTPAYASLEMLKGENPDVRDDVYALGCVAYETLTGEHPYNRVPADEAAKQGLKPKRIQNIKKYQWKAIEKALKLFRDDRTESVEKFIHELLPKIRAVNRALTLSVLLFSIGVAVYFAFFQEKTFDPYEEFNIRNELELKVRIDFYKNHLRTLLDEPNFSDGWQEDVWKDVSDLLKLTQGKDEWVYAKRDQIYEMYLGEIDEAITAYKIKSAETLLSNARRYTDDPDALNARVEKLASAYAKVKANAAKQSAAIEQKLVSDQQQKNNVKLFDLALSNVNLQLKCQGRLNMPDLESAVNKLRETDHARYSKLEGRIINSLGECIVQIGKAFPDRANEAKKFAMRIFKSNSYLAGIEIIPRDSCDSSLAGLGARGNRAVCNDSLPDKKSGPDLVVIPGAGSIRPFAIGKYETSIREINLFCKDSRKCAPITGRNDSLPVSNLSFELAKDYLKWLSKKTGKKYRLPTRNEWVYAAKARKQTLDANRNCKLSARGIQKGEELVKADIGAQNDWGLVNHVGNVQEWVYDKGRELVAVGGSYDQSMDDCNVNTLNSQSGNADLYTGFRVLRELGS